MKKLVVLFAGLALAACGSGESGTIETAEGTIEYSQDGKEGTMTLTGEEGEVKIASGGQDVQMPDGFSLYPGAQVITSSTVSHNEGSGVRVVMSTSASPLQVAEFYRKQATAAGIANLSEASQGGMLNLVGEGEDGTTFAVATSGGDGATTVTLIVNKGF